MCGICGIINREPDQQVDPRVLNAMNDTLTHRGPDGEGTWTRDNVGLAHRRLSIIDLSDAGKQPMTANDGKSVLTFNGEVYNFKSLKERFLSDCQFSSTTDSEVVLKLLSRLGKEAVDHFEGMFAFCFYDVEKSELLLARDHFGIKPLYFHLSDRCLVFGSELKSLLASGQVNKEIDKEALNDFFDFMWIPAPRSIFKGVQKLEPGTVLSLNLKTWESRVFKFWEPKYNPVEGKTTEQWLEETDHVIKESVKAHLIADVEVGTFLSGGIDSSLVSHAAKEYSESVSAFTIDFDNVESSEGAFARDVAKQMGIRNHVCHDAEPATLDFFSMLAKYYDEPFSDSSMFPTYLVCKLAAQNLKVCLSGDGGDELFSGYTHHGLASRLNWVNKIPDFLMRPLFGMSSSIFRGNRRIYEWSRRMGQPAETRLLTLARIPGNRYRTGILTKEYRSSLASRQWIIDRFSDKTRHLPPVTQAQIFDLLFYLPGDMLTKVDRASMANSLEVRVPFLSKQVAEFALSIPESQRYQNEVPKFILRELMSQRFGSSHGNRKKKGFSIPLVDWLRKIGNETIKRFVQDSPVIQHGILERHVVQGLFDLVMDPSKSLFLQKSAATDLFSVLMFNAWWENHMGDHAS